MSRKTKILFVVGCVVAGALAIVFLVDEDPRKVSLTISPGASNQVLLTLTNGYATRVHYSLAMKECSPGGVQMVSFPLQNILGHSQNSLEIPTVFTNRWQFVASFSEDLSSSWLYRARQKASSEAWRLNCKLISRWLFPLPKNRIIYGPEMLGNKPVEAEFK